MNDIKPTIHFLWVLLILTSLSCGLFGSIAGGDESGTAAGRNLIRQWASSADASSEYDNPDWSAEQATGAPDTLECGDIPTAWASWGDFTKEWLQVRYETPVIPTEINIYESHTPTQVVRVEVLDGQGNLHEVYTARPKQQADCPYTLSIPVNNADYEAMGVKITIDQSQLGLPWDEIDAVELVGYADDGKSGQDRDPGAQPEQPPVDKSSFELPIANPDQDPSFELTYSGCEDGQEQGSEIEVSVHDDRIDLRFRGTHKKYALLTLPRNLEDDFKDRLVEFALEGRVPSAAGLYIQSVWWFGEKGTVQTQYNSDGTLSGEVNFEGTRKNGCTFEVKVTFEHVPLREE